ncbi:MAG: SgcJ/EcaC family oxidoreductase [Pirellulaceae bacterium]
MKPVLILLLASTCAFSQVIAQDKENATDRAAIEALGKRWQETWNRHDMDALSTLPAEDVDFVTVGGPKGWLKGRTQLRDDHAAKHKTRFKDSVWTTKEMHIKFLRPDLAVAHVL